MPVSLVEWDRTIAPYLHRSENGGRTIAAEARSIQHAINLLSSRPNWPTIAENEIEEAITRVEELIEILDKVSDDLRTALHNYRSKPVE